jgi:hypothetical protein
MHFFRITISQFVIGFFGEHSLQQLNGWEEFFCVASMIFEEMYGPMGGLSVDAPTLGATNIANNFVE